MPPSDDAALMKRLAQLQQERDELVDANDRLTAAQARLVKTLSVQQHQAQQGHSHNAHEDGSAKSRFFKFVDDVKDKKDWKGEAEQLKAMLDSVTESNEAGAAATQLNLRLLQESNRSLSAERDAAVRRAKLLEAAQRSPSDARASSETPASTGATPSSPGAAPGTPLASSAPHCDVAELRQQLEDARRDARHHRDDAAAVRRDRDQQGASHTRIVEELLMNRTDLEDALRAAKADALRSASRCSELESALQRDRAQARVKTVESDDGSSDEEDRVRTDALRDQLEAAAQGAVVERRARDDAEKAAARAHATIKELQGQLAAAQGANSMAAQSSQLLSETAEELRGVKQRLQEAEGRAAALRAQMARERRITTAAAMAQHATVVSATLGEHVWLPRMHEAQADAAAAREELCSARVQIAERAVIITKLEADKAALEQDVIDMQAEKDLAVRKAATEVRELRAAVASMASGTGTAAQHRRRPTEAFDAATQTLPAPHVHIDPPKLEASMASTTSSGGRTPPPGGPPVLPAPPGAAPRASTGPAAPATKAGKKSRLASLFRKGPSSTEVKTAQMNNAQSVLEATLKENIALEEEVAALRQYVAEMEDADAQQQAEHQARRRARREHSGLAYSSTDDDGSDY